jgi:hypothetical protein
VAQRVEIEGLAIVIARCQEIALFTFGAGFVIVLGCVQPVPARCRQILAKHLGNVILGRHVEYWILRHLGRHKMAQIARNAGLDKLHRYPAIFRVLGPATDVGLITGEKQVCLGTLRNSFWRNPV